MWCLFMQRGSLQALALLKEQSLVECFQFVQIVQALFSQDGLGLVSLWRQATLEFESCLQ